MTLLNVANKVYLGAAQADRVYAGAVLAWPPDSGSWGPSESLYAPSAVPDTTGSTSDTFSVGTAFAAMVPGRITAIRYYRTAGMLASRNVSLWANDGSVRFASVNATGGVIGWNTVPITPIIVTEPTAFRVVMGQYGSGAGDGWPYTNTSLTSITPHLRWDAGVYSDPLPSGSEDDYPNNFTFIYNYFVDVVFQEAAAAGPSASLLTGYTPGGDRNDFTGEVGVRIGIGAAPITVDWLGCRVHPGATGTRTLKLYEWFSAAVQRTATVDLTGKPANSYVWAPITPIVLGAGGYYAMLMVCTAGGPIWSNPGPCTMAPSIVNIYDSYYYGGLQTGLNNSMFVGLDLGWS